MSSRALRIVKFFTASASYTPSPFLVFGAQRSSRSWLSTVSFNDDHEDENIKNSVVDDIFSGKTEEQPQGMGQPQGVGQPQGMGQPQGVDPRQGWAFRGVHKAIICGKVGQAPMQKILRNGKTVTIFTVGTGGMYDQRMMHSDGLPKPAQWHRIAVHNDVIGAYAVQQLVKNSAVYVEGDIETRVYNDSINGEVKNVPEICVRRDGRVRLIKTGDSVSNINFEELREGLN